MGTHLNCFDMLIQFKWAPTTYAFIKWTKSTLAVNLRTTELLDCVVIRSNRVVNIPVYMHSLVQDGYPSEVQNKMFGWIFCPLQLDCFPIQIISTVLPSVSTCLWMDDAAYLTIYKCQNITDPPLSMSKSVIPGSQNNHTGSQIILNPCHAEYIKMSHPLLIISQSEYLIQVVDTNSHTH